MSTFDPNVVLAVLSNAQPAPERKKFKSTWKENVQDRVKRWTENRPHQSKSPVQLEWAAHVVEYVNHIYKATRVHGLSKGKEAPPLSVETPLYGPKFMPPTYFDYTKRSGMPQIKPDAMYLKPLTIIHPVYFPELAKCPMCDSSDIKWHSWVATGYRDVHGVSQDELALGYQIRCKACEQSRKEAKNSKTQVCYATTSTEFWERYEEWNVPRGIPHFFRRCAVTRELYRLIVELRPSSTASGLEENVKQWHLNEYNDRKLEYLRVIQKRLTNILIPAELLPFSEPADEAGYNDHPITHDLINDVYAEFSQRSRQQESDKYLRTLTAVVLSIDATFKVTKKASLVSKDKNAKHEVPMKGGVLSMINEMNEIIAWRFCQTQSASEITEMLEGYVTRSELQKVLLAIMLIADNCCHVRSAIKAVLPLILVLLDVFHFKSRYAAVILNGVKNPLYKDALRDIVEAIIKRRAEKGKPAEYWGLEEQEARLTAAYDKWLQEGTVWSAAAPKVHADQLRHVRKGCLVRIRQDVAADGSRIEGSHKGWNSIMRSYASGLENMLFLCRDFVLRRNIRIATRTEVNRQLRPFAASTFGSHHVALVDFTNRLWNTLVTNGKGIPRNTTYSLLPVLEDIASNETFGLVKSESAATFGGLFDIKEEEEEDPDLLHLREDLSEDELAEMLSIDPELRRQPLTRKRAADRPVSTAVEAGVGTGGKGQDQDTTIASNAGHLECESAEVIDLSAIDDGGSITPTPKVAATEDAGRERTDLNVVGDAHTASTSNDDLVADIDGETKTTIAALGLLRLEQEEEEEEGEGVPEMLLSAAVPAVHVKDESDAGSVKDKSDTGGVKRKADELGEDTNKDVPIKKRIRVEGTQRQPATHADKDCGVLGIERFFSKHNRESNASALTGPIVARPVRIEALSATPSAVRRNEANERALQLLVTKLPLVGSSALTPSQALFSRLTELDVRCLRIGQGVEFFIFMDLRAELGWASFKMNAFKWVNATQEYNNKLTEYGRKHPELVIIKKNPRALLDKLVDVEQKILSRIARRDYKSRQSGDQDSPFWIKHCHAVPLGKDMNEAQDDRQKLRQAQKCRRCKTLMYPNGRNGEGNHKRGTCSDGGPVHLKNDASPPWPQPHGIFNAEHSEFSIVPFLAAVQDLYQKSIVEKVARNDLSMEMEAFASMFMTRTEYDKPDPGMIVFRLFAGYRLQSPIPVDNFIVEFAGKQYLRIDCLADS